MESLLFATGLTTLAVGGAMALFAWRVVLQNRRQEAARVELLSSLAFHDGAQVDGGGPDASFHRDDAENDFEADEFRREQPIETSSLFVEPERSGAASRRTIALAAVAVVMVVMVGAYKWFAGTTPTVPSQAASATTVSVAPRPPETTADPEPRVELLALEHSATSGAFLITGRVRNPTHGAPLHDVIAVVTIKDEEGRSLMTVSAPVTPAVLNAGESSNFSVAAAKATHVGGYSVRFDARERSTIPQIDRRRAGSS